MKADIPCTHQKRPFLDGWLCTLTNTPCTGTFPDAKIDQIEQDCYEPDKYEIRRGIQA